MITTSDKMTSVKALVSCLSCVTWVACTGAGSVDTDSEDSSTSAHTTDDAGSDSETEERDTLNDSSGSDSASEEGDTESEVSSDADSVPWPTTQTELPDCVPYEDGFDDPEVVGPSGLVQMSLSAELQPTEVAERVEIEILNADGDTRDYGAEGTLSITSNLNMAVIDVTDVTYGSADALISFLETGRHTLTARFTDDDGEERTGTADVVAYGPQLPIWEMAIDETDLHELKANPYDRIKVPAVLTVDGTSYETEVRIHGGSSRDYPKKSFRFDLGPDLTLEDTHDHIILRAEWNDKTMLRNYLSLEVFRNATWIPTSEAEIVHFRINDRYYGVMWHVERIGGDFLRVRGLNNETGSMYEADPDSSCWPPGGDLTPVDSMEIYQCIYDQKKGDTEYDDLIALIETSLQLPDDEFEQVIDTVIDVDEYLVYMAAMSVIQNQDHIKKNYYLFRDPDAEDDRWIVFPWDMELTFGHLWSEENDVLEEAIVVDGALDAGVCPGFCNHLMTRLYNVDEYRTRYYEFIDLIVETTFTSDFIDERIDNVLCRAAPDVVADSLKRAELSEYLSLVDEIRYFVEERRAFILEE